ncbi:Transposon Ty3-G Gag-Pol polyprotein, partial [Nosema granulosis]
KVDEIIKENSIYLRGYKFRLIIDTGSQHNFITRKVVEKINISPWKLKDPLKLYTCLLEEFIIEDYVSVEFEVRGIRYRGIFYILPKREDYTVILGRDWIKNNKVVESSKIISATSEEALERLNQTKEMGYTGIVCEIKTKPGFKIVEVPYRISQAMEIKVDKEIERLLKKGYVRESRSSWLNNVRPVEKKDGTVRLTTNLVGLNSLVDLDSYSLPRME